MSEKNNKPCEVEDRDHYEAEQFESEEEYYIKAFKRLSETGKHTWNWAAFLFGSMWMLYRKMYLYGFLFLFTNVILSRLAVIPIALLSIKSDLAFILLFVTFFWFLPNVLLGYLGNAMYYEAIEKRIQKGYHLLDKYCPTSIPSILGGVIYICFADWISRKLQQKTKVKSEINEETIRAYLNPNKKIHIAVKIANVFVCFSFLIKLIAR